MGSSHSQSHAARDRAQGLFLAVVVMFFSASISPARGHWEPPAAPKLGVTTAGPTVFVRWDSSWLDRGYLFYFAPMDLSWVGQINMAERRHLLVDLWDGAELYVAARAYNESGGGDFSNVGIVRIDYPSPASVVVPDSGTSPMTVVEAADFGSAVYSGTLLADGLSVGIHSLWGKTPFSEMTAAFNADGAPGNITVEGWGVTFTYRGDSVDYEMLHEGTSVDGTDIADRNGDGIDTILRGIAADRTIGTVTGLEGTEPRWLSHLAAHPFHAEISSNPGIMALVEALFTARAMRQRLLSDICSSTPAPDVCQMWRQGARTALTGLVDAIERTLSDLIRKEWIEYKEQVFPISYRGMAQIDARFYGPSGKLATCSAQVPLTVTLSSDGILASLSPFYSVETVQNFGYAESCSITVGTSLAEYKGSHDYGGNFSFTWGEVYVAGVNFAKAAYGNGNLDVSGVGVEQSITFVLDRIE